jgi:multidrug efflux pump subunit AcrA (membrane-fusion protein)
MRKTILTSFLATVCAAIPLFAAEPPLADAYTQPSMRRTFSFDAPGVVAEVMVVDGDVVKAGQPLIRQESRLDEVELEIRKMDAESVVEIEAAQKEYDLRKLQYDRKKEGAADGVSGYSQQEVEEAKITMELALLKIQEATQKKTQAQAVLKRQQTKVDMMKLASQIDGVVEKISVDAGEMADPQKPEGAISVVKNDPLWVEIQLLETWQVAKLKMGQELDVRYTIDSADQWQKAKIIYIAPVADSRAATQLVRLELPNPNNRYSGLEMKVKLPAELAKPESGSTSAGN